jgi:hypothetical protein
MKNLIDYTQVELGLILDSIENHRSYYIGGTLCIDKLLPNNDVMTFKLSDCKVFGFISDQEMALSEENMKKVFNIYLKHKGKTQHFIENIQGKLFLNL